MHRRDGFTLFELLTVVLLLVVVAGVTVPQYYYATAEANEAALITDLKTVRDGIEAYWKDHDSQYPGLADGSVSETTLVRQLTRRTDAAGRSDLQGQFGPYLMAGIPVNPFNGMDTIQVVRDGAVPSCDNSTGWIYHHESGTFKANCGDTGPSGEPLSSL